MEQYRLYEALEIGSIPVVALEEGNAREYLPPEFFESPMMFVEDWKDAPRMMMELWNDPQALLKRQEELLQWYDRYMLGRVKAVEAVLDDHYQRAKSEE